MRRTLIVFSSWILLFPFAAAEAQRIEIHFEYANADATVEALTLKDKESVERLTTLRDTNAVIAKRAARDPGVTTDIYKESFLHVISGEAPKNDPFQWQFCLSQLEQVRTLIAALRKNEQIIRSRVAQAISPRLDSGVSLAVNVHYVIGGVSAGWEQGSADFYVGLPFYKGDLEGIVWTMQHELFHNAQFAGFHDQSKDLAQLGERQQEIYRFLDELYREGTATYVANIGSFPPDAPYIAEMRAPAINNWNRMKDNFVLLDTILYRLEHDSGSHYSDFRSLGFDWDWQNPMYYAGEYISRTLTAQGHKLSAYMRRRPTVFARDYVTACTIANKCLYPFSSEAAAAIIEIDERLAKANSKSD